jgi:PTH1 family peptidyl-tRNA hydrolase
MVDERWLVAGLGNPGPRYAGNRHNVGFMSADVLARRMASGFKRGPSSALLATGRLAGIAVIVVKPMSFMNLSGGPLAAASGYYKIPPDRVIVIHDELDLPFEVIRLKLGGGDNGHNGLKSVTSALRTREYYRVRIGIGRPPGRQDPADYVLTDFASAERKELPLVIEQGADAVETLLRDGLAAAQNLYHPAAQDPRQLPDSQAVRRTSEGREVG